MGEGLFAAQTRVGWIPVTGTGMRIGWGRCRRSDRWHRVNHSLDVILALEARI